MNVWRTKKTAEGVLVVTFPKEQAVADCPLSSVTQGRSYVIPFADIQAFPECMLASYIACEPETAGCFWSSM